MIWYDIWYISYMIWYGMILYDVMWCDDMWWKPVFGKPVFGKPVFGNRFSENRFSENRFLENRFLETSFWKSLMFFGCFWPAGWLAGRLFCRREIIFFARPDAFLRIRNYFFKLCFRCVFDVLISLNSPRLYQILYVEVIFGEKGLNFVYLNFLNFCPHGMLSNEI